MAESSEPQAEARMFQFGEAGPNKSGVVLWNLTSAVPLGRFGLRAVPGVETPGYFQKSLRDLVKQSQTGLGVAHGL